MQDAKVCMGEWPCSSWDITVALKALLIADTRLQGGDAPIYVVQIGEAEGLSPATMARLASRLRTRSSNMSGQDAGPSRWARVRPNFIILNHGACLSDRLAFNILCESCFAFVQ